MNKPEILSIIQGYCNQSEVHTRLLDIMISLMCTNKKGKWDGGARQKRRALKGKASNEVNAFVEGVSTEMYNLVITHDTYNEDLSILGTQFQPNPEGIAEHSKKREDIYEVCDAYIAEIAYDLRSEAAKDFQLYGKQFVPATEHIDVRKGIFAAYSPKHTHFFQENMARMKDELEKFQGMIGERHILSAEAMSNTPARIRRFNYDVTMYRRRFLIPEQDDKNAYLPNSQMKAFKQLMRMSTDELYSIAIKTPYTNFDYRLRKYAMLLIAITQGKVIRAMFATAEKYMFSPDALAELEGDILAEGITLKEAVEIASLDVADTALAEHEGIVSAKLYTLCRGYKEVLDTGSSDLWAERDAIASGIVNALHQLGHHWALIIGDFDNPDHKHARRLFAEWLVEYCPYFVDVDPSSKEFDAFIKLVLSPLMYGARQPGVYKALIGERWDENREVDEELYAEGNQFMLSLPAFDGVTPDELHNSLGSMCDMIAAQYHECFPELSEAMDVIGKWVLKELMNGEIPRLVTPSGSVIVLSTVRRKDATHQVTFEHDGKSKEVWVSEKGLCVLDLVSAAFSWFMHNTDAEIITLLSVQLAELSIPHFTNHDAVFVRYIDIPILIETFNNVLNEINGAQMLVTSGGCEPSGPFQPFPKTAKTLVR